MRFELRAVPELRGLGFLRVFRLFGVAGLNFESSRNGSDALQQFVELGETAAGWSPVHPSYTVSRESDWEADAKLREAKKALADSEVCIRAPQRLQ